MLQTVPLSTVVNREYIESFNSQYRIFPALAM